MIEIIAMAQCAFMQYESEAKARQEFYEELKKQPPEIRAIMLEAHREVEKERTIERRHQEQVQAQRAIADAIRYAARPRYY
jgi:hypothetical protein